MVLVLNPAEAERLLEPADCFPLIERVYRELADDTAVNRPRAHTFMPVAGRDDSARFLFKTIEGGSSRLGVYVLRINAELWVPPSGTSSRVTKIGSTADGRFTEFIMLFNAANGRLLAIFPDGHLQKMRVALTHALAAKYLARPDSKVLGLYGSGWQAGAQAEVFATVRKLERIQIFSPNKEHRERFVRDVKGKVDVEIAAVVTPEDAMKNADIVVGATNSGKTVIRDRWVRPGMHISSVRARAEIERKILSRANRIVVHNKTESIDHWCGEIPPGLVDRRGMGFAKKSTPQLSDIVGRHVQGRLADEDVTVFVDGDRAGGPGLGIQFAAVSYALFEKAQAARARGENVGNEIPLDWFLDREDHP
jgi:alanine dehydrogenase